MRPLKGGFYLSNGDAGLATMREVYEAIRRGFGARRIPRKTKKALRDEWLAF